MRFPYLAFRRKFSPIIPIKIKGKTGWVEFYGYVDSGAGYSLFSPAAAEILELEYKECKKTKVTIGDGSQIEIYISKPDVRLAGKKFRCAIGFSEELGIGFNIIGRADVFDRFKICFDDKEKVVEFHPKS